MSNNQSDDRPRCEHLVVYPMDNCVDCIKTERDRLKAEVKDLRYSLEHIEGDERYANLRARHAALVEAAENYLHVTEPFNARRLRDAIKGVK
jgi:uncharacterized protein YhaN